MDSKEQATIGKHIAEREPGMNANVVPYMKSSY